VTIASNTHAVSWKRFVNEPLRARGLRNVSRILRHFGENN
jgi:hypothetical protein